MSEVRDRKDALLEAGLALASELSLPMVLQRIVDLAAEVTDARYGALGVIGAGGGLVDFITTGISAKQRSAIGALPHGRGTCAITYSACGRASSQTGSWTRLCVSLGTTCKNDQALGSRWKWTPRWRPAYRLDHIRSCN
jgi:hypothetical protein